MSLTIPFEIFIDERFSGLPQEKEKNLISMANDFEDGRWRGGKFDDFIWDSLPEVGLSAEERDKLIGEPKTTLRRAAQNLRLTDDDGKGSEIAEILLHGILRRHFGALPVVPKIFYKQNPNDPVKGADSVHIVINENTKDFTLWLGEAKFYTDLYTSFNKTIASVKDILQTTKIRTENKLILNLKDLDILIKDKDLSQRIRKVLSENEPIDGVKQKLHVPILLLHECQITRDAKSMDELYKQMIIEKHWEATKKYFDSQDGKLSSEFLYDKVVFHLILFPVPSKNDVVDSFFKTASAMRGS